MEITWQTVALGLMLWVVGGAILAMLCNIDDDEEEEEEGKR